MEIVPGFQDIPAEVAVGQHYTLCIPCGAGGVEYGRDVHRVRVLDVAVAGICLAVHLDEAEIIQTYYEPDYSQSFQSSLAFSSFEIESFRIQLYSKLIGMLTHF